MIARVTGVFCLKGATSLQNPVPLKEWKLELWMGYETSMRQHEHNALLMCAASTKIIRTDTVMDQMKLCMKSGGGGKEAATKTLLGCIVMTKYNNATYRIDDIDWNKKASDTFPVSSLTFIPKFLFYQHMTRNHADLFGLGKAGGVSSCQAS